LWPGGDEGPEGCHDRLTGCRDFTSEKPEGFISSTRSDYLSEIGGVGKNGQVRSVFRTLFIPMAGLVVAQVLDPVTAQQVVGVVMGMGG